MDFKGIFGRDVTFETSVDGKQQRASIPGLKTQSPDGWTTSTIFGIGADKETAKAALTENVIAAALENTAKFMKMFGDKRDVIARAGANTVSIGEPAV